MDLIEEQRVSGRPAEVVTLSFSGFVTSAAFRLRMSDFSTEMCPGNVYALLFDILQVSGYEPALLDDYIRWHKQHATQVHRVAVVTNRMIWRLVVRTLSVAGGGPIEPFDHVDAAGVWLRSGR
jgi:hypothetical protein